MHFCTAYIQIAGDSQQVVHRGKFDPVSWPEVNLLRFVHGDDAVLEVKPFVWVEQSPRAERERLTLKYGREAIIPPFGNGRNLGDSEIDAAEADIAYGERWKNPLTQLEETIEDAPPRLDLPPARGKVKPSVPADL